MPGNRKLGRPTSQRMAMLKGMVTFLLETGRIETTVTRAKEVSALTDKMVTLGKANTLAAKRQALSFLKKEAVVYKLFSIIAPNYEERNGGYTRVLKIGPRRGDGAEMAVIEMVDAESIYAPKKDAKKSEKEAKKAAKEAEKAEKAAEKAKAEEPKKEVKKTVKKAPKAEAPKEEPKEEPKAEPQEEIQAEDAGETKENAEG